MASTRSTQNTRRRASSSAASEQTSGKVSRALPGSRKSADPASPSAPGRTTRATTASGKRRQPPAVPGFADAVDPVAESGAHAFAQPASPRASSSPKKAAKAARAATSSAAARKAASPAARNATSATAARNSTAAGQGTRTQSRASASGSPLGPVMVDVAGHSLTAAERRRLRHPLVGGVILFARNYQSPEQLRALTAEIHACRKPSLLIAVDQEGGRVQRFRDGFTAIPPMRTLGELWDQDVLEACRHATEVGRQIGQELRDCGVDLSFTPVLDLDYGHSKVIGNRAFHHDPRVVTMLARCLSHGLLLAGLANCGKHFPGHGFADADSHVAMPRDERSLDEILAADAAPYHWLGDALTAVMPAHVVYPQVDRKPAGFSKRWLQTILRRRLGFDGVVFSDDLVMEAASVAGGITARAEAALKAGCDMVLVCNRPDLADEVLATLQPPANPHLQRRLAALRPRTAS